MAAILEHALCDARPDHQDNFNKLEIAWRFKTDGSVLGLETNFEGTHAAWAGRVVYSTSARAAMWWR